jgi:hypothetical protein
LMQFVMSGRSAGIVTFAASQRKPLCSSPTAADVAAASSVGVVAAEHAAINTSVLAAAAGHHPRKFDNSIFETLYRDQVTEQAGKAGVRRLSAR